MPDSKVLLVIDLKNDYLWDKRKPMFTYAYTSPAFRAHMKTKNYKEVVICGLDECGCIGATAWGACKTGVKVIMLTSCIGSRFSEKKVKKQREKLTSLGVIYRYE